MAYKFAEVITSSILHHTKTLINPEEEKEAKPIDGDGHITYATYWCVKFPPFPKKPAEIDLAYLKDFTNKLRYVEEKCKIKILKTVLGEGATSFAHRIHDLTRNS